MRTKLNKPQRGGKRVIPRELLQREPRDEKQKQR